MSDETNIDGVDDTPSEVNPQPKTYTEEEVAGIISQRDSLMDEKKDAIRKAEVIRIKAEQDTARQSGSMEELEKSMRSEHEREKSEWTTKLDAAYSQTAGQSKKALLGQLASQFNNPEDAEMLNLLISTSFDGLESKTEFKDLSGKVVTTDLNEYIKWMGKNPTISMHMKADAANGGGAFGSKQSGGATNFSAMSLTERSRLANENPKLYAQLSGQSK